MIKNLPYELRDLEIHMQKLLVRMNVVEAQLKGGSVSPEEFAQLKAEVATLFGEVEAVEEAIEEVKVDITKLSTRYLVHFNIAGPNWQEVYSDGWVRQGRYRVSGGSSSAHNETIPFTIAMRDANYTVYTSYIAGTTTSSFYGYEVPGSRTTSNMQIRSFNGHEINYTVEGFGDSAVVTALGATPDY